MNQLKLFLSSETCRTGWIALGCALAALAIGCSEPQERTARDYWPDGTLRETRAQIRVDDTLWLDHGVFASWYESGAKHQFGAYDSGQKTGLWTTWYNSDPPLKLSEGNFVAGEMDGQWRYWMNHAAHMKLASGDSMDHGHVSHTTDSQALSQRARHPNPHKTETYRLGVAEGLWLSWHPDGSIADSMNYVAGKLHGRVISYHSDGQLASEVVYDHGVIVRPLMIWDADGRLLQSDLEK